MTSILTNTSAMSAVSALAGTQRSLATTETEITTGLQVSSAKDNASYWSIATSMKTRIGEIQSVNDGLDLTSGVLSTTAAGLTQVLKLMQGIAQDLVTAQTTGVDLSAVQADISAKQQGIISAAEGATYNGVNWLVTKVVGTETDIFHYDYDGTQALANRVMSRTGTGSFTSTDHAQFSYAIEQTLGSTSTNTTTTNYDGTTHTFSTVANPFPRTGFSSLPSVQSSVNATTSQATTGDLSGYLHVAVPESIGADGAVSSRDIDLSPIQLFKTFSGDSSSTTTFNYTDRSSTSASSGVLTTQAPYLNAGQSDVISGASVDANTDPLKFDLTTDTDIPTTYANVNSAITGITQAASFVGSLQNEVDGSKALNKSIIDALTSGVGSLIDADMNEASTRLNALQTQQQLGTQALSVANDNSKMILKLFGS